MTPFAAHRSLRAMNWLLAALFVAAALRGLVPGMCATLSAAYGAEEDAPASCCSMDLAAAEDADSAAYNPVPAQHPPCAFCNLAFAHVVPAADFAVPHPPVALLEEAGFPLAESPDSAESRRLAQGRAPPLRFG